MPGGSLDSHPLAGRGSDGDLRRLCAPIGSPCHRRGDNRDGCNHDIGTALRVTEDAARMRVDRALEKLHVLLARRGVTSTAAALGVALSNQAITAAPAGLATAITGTALSGGLAAGGLATALKGFAFMNMSNLSTSVAVLAALAALGVAVRETRAERMITLTLATATQENQNAAAHLRELTQRG